MIQGEKNQFRRELLAELRAAFCTEEQMELRSAPLRALLGEILNAATAPLRIAIYAGRGHEPRLLPLLQEYPQHIYALPRCQVEQRYMEFYQVRHPESQLLAGAYGILEPTLDCPLLPAEQVDMIIVPGLAFTTKGERMGMGGGYYDRYLPRASHAQRIALCMTENIRDNLPTESHDVLMDRVLFF